MYLSSINLKVINTLLVGWVVLKYTLGSNNNGTSTRGSVFVTFSLATDRPAYDVTSGLVTLIGSVPEIGRMALTNEGKPLTLGH